MEGDLPDLAPGEAEIRQAEIYIDRITATAARAAKEIGRRWMEDAACVGRDPELWFADGNSQKDLIQEAKAVCMDCPVRLDCLKTACLTRPDGVWGGTTFTQRKIRNHNYEVLSQLRSK